MTFSHMHDEEIEYFESKYLLYLGPGIMMGYNKIIEDNFSFLIGLNFSALFCYNELHGDDNSIFPREGSKYNFLNDDEDDYEIEYYDVFRKVLNTTFRIGIEVRFMLNVSKKINN